MKPDDNGNGYATRWCSNERHNPGAVATQCPRNGKRV
jgi:hypothetical protein